MQELNYIRCGDYFILDIKLQEETRSIGRWGRIHREYLRESNPIRFDDLCLTGELWTYPAKYSYTQAVLGKPTKHRLYFNICQNIVKFINFNHCKNVFNSLKIVVIFVTV